jgi:hypothetical protein
MISMQSPVKPMRARLFSPTLIFLFISGQLAAQEFPEPPRPGEKIFDLAERYEDHFAKLGTGTGTGFKQYSRWLDFVAPRTTPSGDLVNITTLTFLRHHQEARSSEFAEARAAAMAAGIGTGSWRPVGPARAALAAEGGDIGRINAIAFDPRRAGTLYAATPASGLWMSSDEGTSWKSLTDGLGLIGVQDIAVDPIAPDTIYIMTGDAEMRTSPSMGMMKSLDGGKSWLNTGFIWKANEGPFYGYRLAIHPSDPSVLLAGTNFGLVRISEAGKTWKQVIKGGVFYDVLFHPTIPSIVYAASHNAVYRSNDAGETWMPLTQGLPGNPGSDRIRLAVTRARPNTLYVLYGAPDGFSIGLYRSEDGGTGARAAFLNHGIRTTIRQSWTPAARTFLGARRTISNHSPGTILQWRCRRPMSITCMWGLLTRGGPTMAARPGKELPNGTMTTSPITSTRTFTLWNSAATLCM